MGFLSIFMGKPAMRDTTTSLITGQVHFKGLILAARIQTFVVRKGEK
jgi:hypothetical protein